MFRCTSTETFELQTSEKSYVVLATRRKQSLTFLIAIKMTLKFVTTTTFLCAANTINFL